MICHSYISWSETNRRFADALQKGLNRSGQLFNIQVCRLTSMRIPETDFKLYSAIFEPPLLSRNQKKQRRTDVFNFYFRPSATGVRRWGHYDSSNSTKRYASQKQILAQPRLISTSEGELTWHDFQRRRPKGAGPTDCTFPTMHAWPKLQLKEEKNAERLCR